MTGIPPPPDHFDQLSIVIVEVDPRSLIRMAWRDPSTHCRFRSEIRFRFDAPDGSFGVLYAGFDVATAFAETVLRDKPALAGSALAIPLDYREIESRWVIELAGVREDRPLRLIKLYDEGLAAARTDNRIAAIDDYSSTQRWAKAFHHHPITADGIAYMSRYLGARKSVALFDRCKDAIVVASAIPLLDHGEFAVLADQFSLAINRPEMDGAAEEGADE